jgi:hypothetical protein
VVWRKGKTSVKKAAHPIPYPPAEVVPCRVAAAGDEKVKVEEEKEESKCKCGCLLFPFPCC